MSIDASSAEPSLSHQTFSATTERWEELLPQLRKIDCSDGPREMFGEASRRGNNYRWGIAASTGTACDPLIEGLSRLACHDGKPKLKSVDLDLAAASMIDLVDRITNYSPLDAATATLWAAALPALSTRIEPHRWWRLLSSLQQLQESVMQRNTPYARSHLMLGGELGLTLAWRLPNIAACKGLAKPSASAVKAWAECDDDSVTAALANPSDLRLVLASLLRCRPLIEQVAKRKFGKSHNSIGKKLATWVAAMTHTGGTAFSSASPKTMKVDYTRAGLIETAIGLDAESLGPAFSAAKGEPHVESRLVWEVALPDSIHHDRQSQIAIAFPEWDVRRGRFHLDYSGEEIRLEVFGGRRRVLDGRPQMRIDLDKFEQQPAGDWEEVCEYTDDDVHYLELEQLWSGGIKVQRQLLQVRDDRSLLIADAVLPQDGVDLTDVPIDYACSFPLDEGIEFVPESETSEAFLSDGKRRGLVLPLAASEWRVGRTNSSISATSDDHLQLTSRGHGALFTPIWFDFQQRRFDRNRTWRELTIGDQLRLVDRHEAVGYRIQIGSEQWMLYRSLAEERRCRTVLGKHLIADFFCSRFDPGDGSHDELLTVDDSDVEND
ncbi:MAG: hypothetical protein ACR2NZ_11195 [Rubripirellula sp.]